MMNMANKLRRYARNAAIVTGAIAAFTGFSFVMGKVRQLDEQDEFRTSSQRFKAAPEIPSSSDIAKAEILGKYDEAGIGYARLGMADDAQRMARKCPTEECRGRIKRALWTYAPETSAKSE